MDTIYTILKSKCWTGLSNCST